MPIYDRDHRADVNSGHTCGVMVTQDISTPICTACPATIRMRNRILTWAHVQRTAKAMIRSSTRQQRCCDSKQYLHAIAEEIASAQSPTYVEQGENPHQSGYITFTDQLGDYMQVDDMNDLVYANKNISTKINKESPGKQKYDNLSLTTGTLRIPTMCIPKET